MGNSLSLCYIPGFGHNWNVPHGEEHRFIPSLYQKRITQAQSQELDIYFLRWGLFENPQSSLDSIIKYQQEESVAAEAQAIGRLQSTLDIMHPEVVVCHSLGSRLLYHAVMAGVRFDSVRKVVLLQPDIPLGYDLKPFIHNLRQQDTEITYTWCPWDDTLAMVSFFAQELRLGQTPFASELNPTFHPLIPRIGKTWHTRILEDDITYLFS